MPHTASQPLIVELRSASTRSGLRAGTYELQELRPLHGHWMIARCVSAGAGDEAYCWECPLSPEQCRRVRLLQQAGIVRIELTEQAGAIVQGVPQSGGYRAEFSATAAAG